MFTVQLQWRIHAGFVKREGRESKCRDSHAKLGLKKSLSGGLFLFRGGGGAPTPAHFIPELVYCGIHIMGWGYRPPTRPTSGVKRKGKNGRIRGGGPAAVFAPPPSATELELSEGEKLNIAIY